MSKLRLKVSTGRRSVPRHQFEIVSSGEGTGLSEFRTILIVLCNARTGIAAVDPNGWIVETSKSMKIGKPLFWILKNRVQRKTTFQLLAL